MDSIRSVVNTGKLRTDMRAGVGRERRQGIHFCEARVKGQR